MPRLFVEGYFDIDNLEVDVQVDGDLSAKVGQDQSVEFPR